MITLNKGQSILEYLMVLTMVAVVLSAMFPLIQRGVQGMVRTVADQIGNQEQAEQQNDSGYLQSSDTISQVDVNDRTTFGPVDGKEKGPIETGNYLVDHFTHIETTQTLNLGVSEYPPP